MKKFLLLFYSLVLSANMFGQNLVPNYSFEDTTICPTFISQITNAVGWTSFRNSPDYFNSCAPYAVSGISVPSNLCGYQSPRTGNAYAGFFSRGGNNYREWIGMQLTKSLMIGVKYRVSFFVSLSYKASSNIGIATNKLGARFSTISYSSNNSLPLNGYVHIYTDSIIRDTLNWTEVSGLFVADSSYQYIIIGNFFNDSLTSTYSIDTSLLHSYYYLDDVSVIPNDSLEGQSEIINHNSTIQLSPNPTHSAFTLGSPLSFVGTELSIYNSLGEIVRREIIHSAKQEIDLGLEAGVYYIRVASSASATVSAQKLIVY
jgi:OOP family OmpA-OmpF porin